MASKPRLGKRFQNFNIKNSYKKILNLNIDVKFPIAIAPSILLIAELLNNKTRKTKLQ